MQPASRHILQLLTNAINLVIHDVTHGAMQEARAEVQRLREHLATHSQLQIISASHPSGLPPQPPHTQGAASRSRPPPLSVAEAHALVLGDSLDSIPEAIQSGSAMPSPLMDLPSPPRSSASFWLGPSTHPIPGMMLAQPASFQAAQRGSLALAQAGFGPNTGQQVLSPGGVHTSQGTPTGRSYLGRPSSPAAAAAAAAAAARAAAFLRESQEDVEVLLRPPHAAGQGPGQRSRLGPVPPAATASEPSGIDG